jgi:hypothetical protein
MVKSLVRCLAVMTQTFQLQLHLTGFFVDAGIFVDASGSTFEELLSKQD